MLKPAAQLASTPNFAKDLLNYVTVAKARSNPLVNNSINIDIIPEVDKVEFQTANAVRPYLCPNLNSCDLFYDLDWSYRLRVEI